MHFLDLWKIMSEMRKHFYKCKLSNFPLLLWPLPWFCSLFSRDGNGLEQSRRDPVPDIKSAPTHSSWVKLGGGGVWRVPLDRPSGLWNSGSSHAPSICIIANLTPGQSRKLPCGCKMLHCYSPLLITMLALTYPCLFWCQGRSISTFYVFFF